MKKVKLKLKYDELAAMYADLFNNVVPNNARGYQTRLMVAVLTKFYMHIGPKIHFRTSKPVALTLDMPTACALMLWIYHRERSAAEYLDNVYKELA